MYIGREYKALFICTSEGVADKNFQPLDLTKSMCDAAVFNTVITRAASLIVAVGNPFRLIRIEQEIRNLQVKEFHDRIASLTDSSKYQKEILTSEMDCLKSRKFCWITYLHYCWTIKSLQIVPQISEQLPAETVGQVTYILVKQLLSYARAEFETDLVDLPAGINEDIILRGYNETLNKRAEALKLGIVGDDRGWVTEQLRETSAAKPSKGLTENVNRTGVLCWLKQQSPYRCLAYPIEKKGVKSQISGPYVIKDVANRNGAFDGAIVRVSEVPESRGSHYVSYIEKNNFNLLLICKADNKDCDSLMPIDDRVPRIVNLPHIKNFYLGKDSEEGHLVLAKNLLAKQEIACFDLKSLGKSMLPKITNTIPLEFSKDLLFIVKPLYWPKSETFPVGAVIAFFPRSVSLYQAQIFLNARYMVPRKEVSLSEPSFHLKVRQPSDAECHYKEGIAIVADSGYSTCAFSLSEEGGKYVVYIHIPNVGRSVETLKEFQSKNDGFDGLEGDEDLGHFGQWASFTVDTSDQTNYFPVLPQSVVNELSHTTGNQKSITLRVSFSKSFDLEKIGSFSLDSVKCKYRYTLKEIEKLLSSESSKCTPLKLQILYKIVNQLKRSELLSQMSIKSQKYPCASLLVEGLLSLANNKAAEKIAFGLPRHTLLKIARFSLDSDLDNISKVFSGVFPFSMFPDLLESRKGSHQRIYSHSMNNLLNILRAGMDKATLAKAREEAIDLMKCPPDKLSMLDALKEIACEEFVTMKIANKVRNLDTLLDTLKINLNALNSLHQTAMTSFTNPFDSLFDIIVQIALTKVIDGSITNGALPYGSTSLSKFCHMCTMASQQSLQYRRELSLVGLALEAQESSIMCYGMISLITNGSENIIHIYCSNPDFHNLPRNRFNLLEVGRIKSRDDIAYFYHTFKETSLVGPCQVIQNGNFSIIKDDGKHSQSSLSLFAPGTDGSLHKLQWSIKNSKCMLDVPVETLEKVDFFAKDCNPNTASALLTEISKLDLKEYRPSISQVFTDYSHKFSENSKVVTQGKNYYPQEFPSAPLTISHYKTALDVCHPIRIWITCDSTGYVATPAIQLIELHPDLRLCLQHQTNPEACFTPGVEFSQPKDVWSSIEEYTEFWKDIVLAEAAASSIRNYGNSDDNKILCISNFMLKFDGFKIPRTCIGEEVYEPTGNITATLSKDFTFNKSEFFQFGQGSLVCVRYEIKVSKADLPEAMYKKFCSNCHFDGYARAVFHMVVKSVRNADSLEELEYDDEIVREPSALLVSNRI